MSGFERRAHKRYVIDGLMIEIGGVVHETVDVSTRAVVVVRCPGVDYTAAKAPFHFKSTNARALNQPVSTVKFLYERPTSVVLEYVILEYRVDQDVWESILSRHDVRADHAPLEDVFA